MPYDSSLLELDSDLTDAFLGHLQAGPGTIAEALIRGLPIILNDFIPGQVYACASTVIFEFIYDYTTLSK